MFHGPTGMKRRLAFALLAMVASLSTTSAEPLHPQTAIPSLPEIKVPLNKPLFTRIMAGSLAITLEKTTLADIAKAFGGETRHHGDAGDATTWLCFAGLDGKGASSLFWFVSDEMGGDEHAVMRLAQEPNPSGRRPEGCAAAPGNLKDIDFGVPGIGARMSDVTAQFGAATPGHHRNAAYAALYASPELEAFTVTQSLVYTAQDGKVVGVAATQVTTN
jgi:hypothetical protein